MQIFLEQGGKQTGPLSIEQVNQLLQQGTIRSTNLAWVQAWGNWQPVANLPGVVLSSPMPKPIDLSGISLDAASRPNPKLATIKPYVSHPVQTYQPPTPAPRGPSSKFKIDEGITAIIITGLIGFFLSWITCGCSMWIAVPLMIYMAIATDWSGGKR